jgi:hypothetical protein
MTQATISIDPKTKVHLHLSRSNLIWWPVELADPVELTDVCHLQSNWRVELDLEVEEFVFEPERGAIKFPETLLATADEVIQ